MSKSGVRIPFKSGFFFLAFFRYCLSSVNSGCDELKNHNKLLNMFKLWCGPGVRKDLSITL